MNWDDYFFEIVDVICKKSKDRSVKIGAVIVGPDHEIRSTGYNGFPRGINDDVEERHCRPTKYLWSEHAERNAIYNAARMGTCLNDCEIYINWIPCNDCMRAIIQSGIKVVKVRLKNQEEIGKGSMLNKMEIYEDTKVMAKEAGVKIFIEGKEE